MSTADMLEDGFPHGTREGYEKGCRGVHCPAVEDGGYSCSAVETLYRGDYSFRLALDSGMTPSEYKANLALQEKKPKPAAPRPDAIPAAHFEEPVPAAEEPAAPEVEKSEPEVADDGILLEKHGTTRGYSAGCRREDCPGIERVGKSCRQAVADYQRDLKKLKKKGIDDEPSVIPVEAAEVVLDTEQKLEEIGEQRAEVAEQLKAAEVVLDEAIAERDEYVAEQTVSPFAAERIRALQEELALAEAKVLEASNHFAIQEKRIAEAQDEKARMVEQLAQSEISLDVEKSRSSTATFITNVNPPEPFAFEIWATKDGGVAVTMPSAAEAVRLELSFELGLLHHATLTTGAAA